MNREAWLQAAVEEIKLIFASAEVTVPEVRVSVGWPAAKGGAFSKKPIPIGQCWPSVMSEDRRPQIFISPTLNVGMPILTVLTHELVHAVDDCKSGHRGEFIRIARAVGLEGPVWTASVAGGDLREKLLGIRERLGHYPHAALFPVALKKAERVSSVILTGCGECSYKTRVSRKLANEIGTPLCPTHRLPMNEL